MTDLLKWEDMTPVEKLAVKAICEDSLIGFVRVFFQLLQGQRFLRNWHHGLFCRKLEAVYHGKIPRLIVNCPPGSTKTEIFSIHFPAWAIVQNMKRGGSHDPSRWLPISYSDDLVKENSGRVKEIIDSQPFLEMWPMSLSDDTSAKNNWKYVDVHLKQHKLYGTSLMGQVTGRRAGFMLPGFTGCLTLDDPLPTKDADFGRKIEKYNKALNRIVRSRLAQDNIPIVMVQQRIAKNDSTAFLMGPKSPDKYELVKVPGIIDRAYVDSLDEVTRAECIRDTGFSGSPVSYWPQKEPTETLMDISKSDPYLYNSQYQQAPDDAFLEGVIFRKEIEAAVADGRVCRLPIEKSLLVYTFWDIGLNDHMAIWLMQPFRMELRLIGAYMNNNESMEHYINWLHDFRDTHGIRFGDHYGPHDLAVRDVMSGKSREDVAQSMGIRFIKVERPQLKTESIDALKRIFPRILIDPERCGLPPPGRTGISPWDGLRKYRREWDPDNEVFRTHPVHDWTSNPADALQQMGLAWKDKVKKSDDDEPRRPTGAGSWMG